jgi:hypothetical protein
MTKVFDGKITIGSVYVLDRIDSWYILRRFVKWISFNCSVDLQGGCKNGIRRDIKAYGHGLF